jgi:hypothetical protein
LELPKNPVKEGDGWRVVTPGTRETRYVPQALDLTYRGTARYKGGLAHLVEYRGEINLDYAVMPAHMPDDKRLQSIFKGQIQVRGSAYFDPASGRALFVRSESHLAMRHDMPTYNVSTDIAADTVTTVELVGATSALSPPPTPSPSPSARPSGRDEEGAL